MDFIKKILVLKEIEEGFSVSGKRISGICRIEQENGVTELFLTLINAAAKDGFSYAVSVIDAKGKPFFYNLGARPTSFKTLLPQNFSIIGGVATGIFCVKENLPVTVAFAREDGFDFTLCDFKKAVAEKCLNDKKENEKQSSNTPTTPQATKKVEEIEPTIKPPYPPAPNPDPTATPPEEFPSPKAESQNAYDDEAVATENYYELDDEITQKLNAVKEMTYEKVRIEDGEFTFTGAQKEIQSGFDFDCAQNEKDSCSSRKDTGERNFYLSVRKELDKIFNEFPPENTLEKTFPKSRWARVNYSPDKYYIVGLIKEGKSEKYICYGVPAVYSENPPEELAGYCTFIPRSIFDLNGDGYWIMFQDALTGKCVTPTKVD
jgi:hypothetical protein